jgi:hypothetical protein
MRLANAKMGYDEKYHATRPVRRGIRASLGGLPFSMIGAWRAITKFYGWPKSDPASPTFARTEDVRAIAMGDLFDKEQKKQTR